MDENDSQRTMTSVMPDLDLSEATDSLIELPILFGSSAATTTATTTATLQDEVFFIDGFPQKVQYLFCIHFICCVFVLHTHIVFLTLCR